MGQEENGVILKKAKRQKRKFKKGKPMPKRMKTQVKDIVNTLNANDLNIAYSLIDDDPVGVTTNAGLVTNLLSLAQGDGEANRSGNTVYVRGFNLRYWCSGSQTSLQTTANPKVRCVIFKQKVNNTGAFLTTAAALFAGAASVDLMADQLPAWNVSDQYQVFYDRVHTLGSAGVGESTTVAGVLTPNSYVNSETDVMQYSHSFGQKGLKVQYNGTTAASQQTNHLYCAFFAQVATSRVNMYCRIVYEE